MEVLAVARPLRRIFDIASGRLLRAIGSPGRSLAILDSVDPTLVCRFRNKIETELLANNAGKKAAHRMLLPFGGRHDSGDRSTGWRSQHRKNAGVLGVGPSIARMWACLVSGCVAGLPDEGTDRVRDLGLLVFRGPERVVDLDLDLVMGSSEVMRRHPPHHLSPARAKPRQGKTPKRAFAASKSP